MLEARECKALSTEDLVKMAWFVLENNYFEFNSDVKNKLQKQQLVQSFHHLAPVYLWMIFKLNICNSHHGNLWYSFDTSVAFSSLGPMVKKNLKSSE